jgi:hypothetical protein
MKRIVRLTESDLTRIVRRVIKESKKPLNEGVGATAFETISDAMFGPGTNEDNVLKGCNMINSAQAYKEALNLVKAEGYNTIMAWIATDMDYRSKIGYDKTEAAYTYWPGEQKARGIIEACSANLRKYSGAETIVKV